MTIVNYPEFDDHIFWVFDRAHPNAKQSDGRLQQVLNYTSIHYRTENLDWYDRGTDRLVLFAVSRPFARPGRFDDFFNDSLDAFF